MILNQPGQMFFCESSTVAFSVGQQVVANTNSRYAGLKGTIIEIRDGDDKETDNSAPDIYCKFSDPNSYIFAEELEKRFSMPIVEITYGNVIMAPEMLEPKMQFQIAPQSMYVLTYYIDSDEHSDNFVLAASNSEVRLRELLESHKSKNSQWNTNPEQFELCEYNDGNSIISIAESDEKYLCYSILEVPFETAAKGGKVYAA